MLTASSPFLPSPIEDLREAEVTVEDSEGELGRSLMADPGLGKDLADGLVSRDRPKAEDPRLEMELADGLFSSECAGLETEVADGLPSWDRPNVKQHGGWN